MRPFRRSSALVAIVLLAAGIPASATAGPWASGTELWTARYAGHAKNYASEVRAVATSPDGSAVFITGTSGIGGGKYAYATVAYDTATGSQRWASMYKKPFGENLAHAIAVGADGSDVFVTGDSGGEYATVAYDAATGMRVWVARYRGPGFDDQAVAIVASPGGSAVFVTGDSADSNGVPDYATVGYDASTGRQLWVSRYDGPSHDADLAQAISVSRDGSAVFVTGGSEGPHGLDYDYATAAYDAVSGSELWSARFGGPYSVDGADAVAVAPDGSAVFVSGSRSFPHRGEWDTVAYDAATGTRRWVGRHVGTGDVATGAIAVSPDGATVFVAGFRVDRHDVGEYLTLAFDARTGKRRWIQHVEARGPAGAEANGIVASPDGSTVYVTGVWSRTQGDDDYLTIAYDAASGTRLWSARYGGPSGSQDDAFAIAIGPNGSAVFVAGESGADAVTVAYRTG